MLTTQEKLWLEKANDRVVHNAHIIDYLTEQRATQHDHHVNTWAWHIDEDYAAMLREYDDKPKELFVDLSKLEALLRV